MQQEIAQGQQVGSTDEGTINLTVHVGAGQAGGAQWLSRIRQALQDRAVRPRWAGPPGVNIIGVVFALAFFPPLASVGFTGDPWWLVNEATKWVIAGVVAVVGISLLASALPGRSKQQS